MRYWLLPLLFAASCYQVRVASGTFTCQQPEDRCPDGQVCSAGKCVNPGDERDLAPAEADLSTQPAPDLTSGPPDLSTDPRDLTMGGQPDMADPCAAGWTEISAGKIYACRRAFSVTGGSFANLCRAGYHVCTGADDVAAAGTMAASMRCSAAGSFFTTAIDIALKDIRENQRTANGICMPGGGDTSRALLGCGVQNGVYTLGGGGTCNGLGTAMRCSMAIGGWTCTSAKEITHASGSGGVLCCVN